jgi:hypothetical protein
VVEPPTAEQLGEFFDNVIETLSLESQWTKGELARTEADHPSPIAGKYARKWCIEGAITLCHNVALFTLPKPALSGLLRRALKTGYTLTAFNDNSALAHADMITQLKTAVARIRSGEVTL